MQFIFIIWPFSQIIYILLVPFIFSNLYKKQYFYFYLWIVVDKSNALFYFFRSYHVCY